MQELQVQSLGREDPLEEEMATATRSSILAWKIPWTEEPGGADYLIRAYSALCLLPPEADDQCMIANMISA